jgi:hypothetical protein
MAIVAGFDVHRRQITFDALNTKTGEISRGRIDATPAAVAGWVARFAGHAIDVAVEACTGWLFVTDAFDGGGRRGASGRAGGDQCVAWPYAAGQDRSRGRSVAA